MNKTMIEQSDRGITIAKPLAWTMVTALVAAGIWLGSENASTKTSLATVLTTVTKIERDYAALREQLNLRLGAVEVERARDGGEMVALRRDLTEFRQEIRELKALLQQINTQHGAAR